jgi:ribose transport system ATP-binding protein
VKGEAAMGDGVRIAIHDLRKSFGATDALGGVSLRVRAGEVLAVIGENGAGKSTLMNVLAGAVTKDSGELALDGEPYAPRSPTEAHAAGVVMVHQELSLCAHLSVADNIVLGREPSRFGVVRGRERDAIVHASLARVGAHSRIDPSSKVLDLAPADQQLVEIARALAHARCRILILDEPTSSLGASDAQQLFALVRKLKSDGLSILYISHFLEEVRAVADRFTVLRDGKTVGDGDVAETSSREMVHMMAGRNVEQLFPRSRAPASFLPSDIASDVVLAIENLGGVNLPLRASLALHKGEVLGIAGLVGAGRTELLRAVFGLDAVRTGKVRVAAYVGPASPSERLAQGVGLLSEDRKGEGLATSLSIADNVTLSKLPALAWPKVQSAAAARWIEELGIRANGPEQRVIELSGGNQQKIALARLLHHDVDVLLLDEPTRGIDIGSKALIYKRIDRLAASGKSVLLVSSYLPELFGVCDRIAVMCRGELGDAKPVSQWTEHAVLEAATGT